MYVKELAVVWCLRQASAQLLYKASAVGVADVQGF